jgi:hypothetical protein
MNDKQTRLQQCSDALNEARTQLARAQKAAGNALRQARLAKEMTLEDVSKALKLSLFKVWSAEKGKNLTPKLFERYIDSLTRKPTIKKPARS